MLLNLPEEQQAKLADWLLGGMPYHEANVLVGKEFGCALRSLSSYSVFWREVCEPALLRRRSKMVASAEARAEEVERQPGQFDKATLDAIAERAYALAISPQTPAKDVKAVMMLLLKARDQDLHERELGLALSKYQDLVAERKRVIEAEIGRARNSGGVTAETLSKIEAELQLL